MKILYHHRIRGVGAESVHVKAIVDAFRLQGHVVSILAFPGTDVEKSTKTSNPSKSNKSSFISVACLQWLASLTKNAPSFVFEIFEILYNLMIPKRFNKIIADFKPDLIYERYSLFMFASVYLARKHNIPIILEINDAAFVSRIRPIFFKRLATRIERWLFTHCTGLVFVSTYFRDQAAQCHGLLAKTVICPNAAELSKFDLSQYDKNSVKHELGLADKIVCGYTGGFGKWHGIAWFVEQMIPHLQANKQFALLLVGDGATFQAVTDIVMQAGMQEQVILTGRVAHADVPRYLAAMDFGILPDLNEYCSPMKLFESMAMAQGMVLPASDPVKEVVIDGQTSWLFPVKDQAACISKVLMVFSDYSQIQQVGHKARSYIERERQWSDNTALTLSLLDG